MREQKTKNRLQKIDIARGIALLGMVIYHLSWDLGYFYYIPPDLSSRGSFSILARIIAFSFIFLSGFSLFIAHQNRLHYRSFFRRLGMILTASIVVSLTTYFIMPDNFIYFGILHQIALASVVGLLFLRLPIILNILIAIVIFVIPLFFKFGGFNHSALWWIGLSTNPRPSFDFVPFFPWFSAAILGLTTAHILKKFNLTHYLKNGLKPLWLSRFLQRIGRHSLIFYLIHQPILFGGLYLISLIVPPSNYVMRDGLQKSCISGCLTQTNKEICTSFCHCLVEEIEDKNNLLAFFKGEITQTDPRSEQPRNICSQKINEQFYNK